jgi:hypothetical protein
MGAACGCHQRTIGELRKRFVEDGFQTAHVRKQRETPLRIKIAGEAEAKIIALICGESLPGRSRWTLKLLSGTVIELGTLDSISDHRIGDLLKNDIPLLLHKQWCTPKCRLSSLSGWKVQWQFTIADARIKLRYLYPKI